MVKRGNQAKDRGEDAVSGLDVRNIARYCSTDLSFEHRPLRLFLYAGLFTRPDLTILMSRIDIFFGVNRPERIERLTESADNWEFGIRLHGRLGM